MNQNQQQQFDWEQFVAALDKEHQTKFSQSRGYSDEFFAWLTACKLVGLLNGEHIIFPVADKEGTIVGGHYRLFDGTWRYLPKGTNTAPFIIGNIATAKIIYAFESQWDLLALADRLHHHMQPLADTAFIATRGASNTRSLDGLCAPDAVVYAFGQNDTAGQKWVAAIATQCGCKCLRVITPSPHKDVNDWTRAGASRLEIEAAIATAQPVNEIQTNRKLPKKSMNQNPRNSPLTCCHLRWPRLWQRLHVVNVFQPHCLRSAPWGSAPRRLVRGLKSTLVTAAFPRPISSSWRTAKVAVEKAKSFATSPSQWSSISANCMKLSRKRPRPRSPVKSACLHAKSSDWKTRRRRKRSIP